jgi:hypothetical protein
MGELCTFMGSKYEFLIGISFLAGIIFFGYMLVEILKRFIGNNNKN